MKYKNSILVTSKSAVLFLGLLFISTNCFAEARPVLATCDQNNFCVGEPVVLSCALTGNERYLRLGTIAGFASSGQIVGQCKYDTQMSTVQVSERDSLNVARAKSFCTTNNVGKSFCTCDTITWKNGTEYVILGMLRNRPDKTEIVYAVKSEFLRYMGSGYFSSTAVYKATPTELLDASWIKFEAATEPGNCLKTPISDIQAN